MSSIYEGRRRAILLRRGDISRSLIHDLIYAFQAVFAGIPKATSRLLDAAPPPPHRK